MELRDKARLLPFAPGVYLYNDAADRAISVVRQHAGRVEWRGRSGAAGSVQDAVIFLLLAFSGLRRGEALALSWRDVDFAREVIRVRANWSHGRLVSAKGDRVDR